MAALQLSGVGSAMFDLVFVVVVPLALLVITGCPALSTMQTPATVPKGGLRVGVGFERIGTAEKDSNGYITTKVVGQFEINARLGVADNFDLGAKLYLFGVEVGGKYQFAKGDFEAAVAPAIDYGSFGSTDYDGGTETTSTMYLHLPLLLGYKVADSLEIAFGPRAIYMSKRDSREGSWGQSSFTSTGFTAGGFASIQLRIGKAFWIAPEINVYKPLDAGTTGMLWQGGLALLFGGASDAMGPP